MLFSMFYLPLLRSLSYLYNSITVVHIVMFHIAEYMIYYGEYILYVQLVTEGFLAWTVTPSALILRMEKNVSLCVIVIKQTVITSTAVQCLYKVRQGLNMYKLSLRRCEYINQKDNVSPCLLIPIKIFDLLFYFLILNQMIIHYVQDF